MRWEQINGREGNKNKGFKAWPGKRWGHTLASVKNGKQEQQLIYLFGGYGGKNDEQTKNDVHVFDTAKKTWSKLSVKGQAPSPRDSHSCVAIGSRLFIFGGTDGVRSLNDLHVLDTETNSWTEPVTFGEIPEAREGHSATLVAADLYVFGGYGKGREIHFNDLYALNTTTFEWRKVKTAGTPPSSRDSHSCSSYRNKLIVFGGQDSFQTFLADVYILDVDTLVWKKLETFGLNPSARAGHAAECIGRNFFVFGGFTDKRKLFDDVYVLDILTGVWTKATTTGDAPSPRFSLAIGLADAENGVLVFYGGCNEMLEPLPEMFYLHTDMGLSHQEQPLEKQQVSLRKRGRPQTRYSSSSCSETEKEELDDNEEEDDGDDEEESSEDDETDGDDEEESGDDETYPPTAKKAKPVSAEKILSPSRDKPATPLPTMDEPPSTATEEIPSPKPVLFEGKITTVFPYGYTLETTIEGKPFRGLLFTYKPGFSEAVQAYLVEQQQNAGKEPAKQTVAEDQPSNLDTVAGSHDRDDVYYPQMPQLPPLIMPEHYRQLLSSSGNPFLNNLACFP